LKKIKISPSTGSYYVYTGSKVFQETGKLIPDITAKKILVIVDENVFRVHKKKIKSVFTVKENVNFYVLKAGEKSKSYQELNKIYSYMIEKGYGRDAIVVVIGGGVTGDLGAFAASTYMRGVRLVNIPTTLLAAVDSSIGGKTGINFNGRKNMIGSFYQPEAVIIDTDFITTLPEKELTSGIGEIVKYAFLGDEKLFKYIDKNSGAVYKKDKNVIEEIIYKSALIKAGVVTQDEKEGGIRKILNLGHTFAHAYESDLKFKITHGEAVTAGVISSLLLSHRRGLLSDALLETYLKLPLGISLSNKLKSFDTASTYKIMFSDKKNRDGKIKFVLISGIGEILVDTEAEKDDVIYALNTTKHLLS
jgi:3-dehydroquinate synthase